MIERLVFGLFPHPDRLGRLLGPLGLYQRSGLRALVARSGVLEAFPALAGPESLLPEIPRPVPLPEFTPARGHRRGRVGLLAGCVQRHLFPGVNAATVDLLSLAGYEVVVPGRQGCCGALDLHGGRLGAFREQAEALVAAFPAGLGLDFIVTNAAGCGSTMREYARWLPESEGAARVARCTRDVSEVLAGSPLPLGRLEATVAYHDACHLAHGQRVRSQPRALLAAIPGVRLVELRDSDLCCGSAGVYNLLQPEMAGRLLDMKLDRIAETGAPIVAAGNPGCALQIAAGARRRGLALEVRHPVELLARAVAAGDGRGGESRGRRAESRGSGGGDGGKGDGPT